MEKEILIQSHMSRLAIILTKMAIVLFIVGISIYSGPIIFGLGSVFISLFAGIALLFWALLGFCSLGLFFLDPSYSAFGDDASAVINDVNESSAKYLEFFEKIYKYSPPLLISCFILFVISIVLFYFSRRLKRSKVGLIFTSVFLGIVIIMVLTIFIVLSMSVKSNE